jgi:hypothetical protein
MIFLPFHKIAKYITYPACQQELRLHAPQPGSKDGEDHTNTGEVIPRRHHL